MFARSPRPAHLPTARGRAAAATLVATALFATALGSTALARPAGLPAAATVTQGGSSLPPSVQTALAAWTKAVASTPKLVSLFAEKKASGPTEQDAALKARLRVLGDKTFSNREWKTYWTKQAKTAGTLAAAIDAAKLPKSWSEPLRQWESLAKAKGVNQDSYLKAIERERDALEERLESLLEPDDKKSASTKVRNDEPTPYEVREEHLSDLRRRIDLQTSKRSQAQKDVKLIEDQLESEQILLAALRRDVELAEQEHALASSQVRGPNTSTAPWLSTWQHLDEKANPKVDALQREARLEGARERARKVEAGLTRSQIKFRNERIAQLTKQLESDSGVRTWAKATGDTVVTWFLNRAWRIAIGLIAVFLGLKACLRLVARTAAEWLRRAEGDPDDPNDDDQRAVTLATVFSSVARITLFVVAALLALEQIGVDTGPLLGSVAILGLAVSFGSQNLVRDVVNGFFILLENQFAVGDVVEIAGKTGSVEKITIRSTWVRQANGDLHAVPNGSISAVTNMTRDWSRAVVEVGVAYDADLTTVQQAVEKVAEEMFADEAWSDRLMEQPAWVGVTALADSSVNVRVTAKTRAGDQWAAGRELNRRLKLGFDAAGIEIPFPQRVVWQKPAE